MEERRRVDFAYSLETASNTDLPVHAQVPPLLAAPDRPGVEQGYYDEDVNVYMGTSCRRSSILRTSIEFALSLAVRLRCLAKLAKSMDARLKYTIYKTNADFLLVSMGIFDDRRPCSPTGDRTDRSADRAPAEEAYVGRGRTYTDSPTLQPAAPSPQRGHVGSLEKLAVGFDRYIKILVTCGESTSIS